MGSWRYRLPESVRRPLGAARRRVRAVRPGRGAVLVYHRVATPGCDPWHLAVAPDRFTAQLAALQRLGRVLPLADVLDDRARRWSRRPAFAVTFDDAYVDNLEVALPRLEVAGCPTTLFVAPGLLGRPWYWWDVLAHWALATELPPARLVAGAHAAGVLDADRAAALAGADAPRVHTAVYAELRPHPLSEIEDRVRALAADAGFDPAVVDGRPMTTIELDRMAAHPLVTLGVHTMTHPALTRLDAPAARDEMAESARWLAERYGPARRLLAYPYGDTSGTVAALAREAGFPAAVTTAGRGLARSDGDHDRPRLHPHDLDAPAFTRWLRAAA